MYLLGAATSYIILPPLKYQLFAALQLSNYYSPAQLTQKHELIAFRNAVYIFFKKQTFPSKM